jgi:hypothetical protein
MGSLKGQQSLEEIIRYTVSQNAPHYMKLINYKYINVWTLFLKKWININNSITKYNLRLRRFKNYAIADYRNFKKELKIEITTSFNGRFIFPYRNASALRLK